MPPKAGKGGKGGGGGGGGAKQSVGRALIRRHQGYGPRGTGALPKPDHGAAAAGGGAPRAQLSSILEMNSLDDFLETALMAQRDFAAVKERDLLIIDAKGSVGAGSSSAALLQQQQQSQQQWKKQAGPTALAFRQLKVRLHACVLCHICSHSSLLKVSPSIPNPPPTTPACPRAPTKQVPRRPAWHPGMTAAELDRAEKDAFLEWRREIASLEEASGDRARVTPFEKNLEVWRQLWRVLERSHVVVQIVDARDPLFYYSEDLHGYAGEMALAPRHRLILVTVSYTHLRAHET